LALRRQRTIEDRLPDCQPGPPVPSENGLTRVALVETQVTYRRNAAKAAWKTGVWCDSLVSELAWLKTCLLKF
jgi:hypothetical protein